jgi:hypothetical protein
MVYIYTVDKMIFNNDIMSKIIEYSNLDCNILYKIGFLNHEHMTFIREYYNNIFMKNILPKLDYMQYINKYYTCSKCYKIDIDICYDFDRPLCENCTYLIDCCEDCGIYRNIDKLVYHPIHGLYCGDNCIYVCEKCNQKFDDRNNVVDISNYYFICYPCYVQETAIKKYKNFKKNEKNS